jgi:dTDP-4-dehydrorhamnose reductase
MSRSLVIGASGLVGGHLLAEFRRRGEPTAGTCLRETPGLSRLDICDQASVENLLQALRPRVIYLPAALTNVDACEQDPQASYRVNVTGVRYVIQAINRIGARLVYFSSDYIFDGLAGPYSEDDTPNPVNRYGLQKLIAEHLVASQAEDYLILRTTVVYGWEPRGKNFVVRLLQSLREGRPVRVPIDQVGTPTYAPALAAAAIDLAESESRKLINVVGEGRIDRHGFAVCAAQVFGLDERLIIPVATSALGQAAVRPLSLGLTLDRLRNLGLPAPDYHSGLEQMKRIGPSQEVQAT